MALNEFTCRSGGNNLYAGTLDGVNEASTSPLVSYLSGTYDAATRVFTPASGNPVTDGVTTSHWLSITDPDESLRCTGVTTSNASTPDAASLDIVGDIDIRVRVKLDDWTPATNATLLSKWTTAGNQRSYHLQVNTSSLLRLSWTTDGITQVIVPSSVVTGLTDGATKWIRVTLDVDNGAAGNDVKFYLSDDGTSWTQLGTTVTTAGVTSIFAGTASCEVGSNTGGAAELLTGNVYYAEVRDGIGGTVVASPDFAAQSAGTTSFADAQGNTWTVGAAASIVAATTAGLIAKIEAVDATTVTHSDTLKHGGVTTGTRDCRVGGAHAGPSGTSGFPLNFFSGGATTAVRCNLKNDQTYSITAGINITAAGPGIIQGYTSTFNDQGRFTLDGGTTGAGYTLLTFTGASWQLWDFVVQNNGDSGTTGAGLLTSGTPIVASRGKVQNVRSSGIQTSGAGSYYFRDLEVTGCNQSGANPRGGMLLQADCVLERCYIHDNIGVNSNGIRLGSSSAWTAVFDSIIESNGGYGVSFATNGGALYLFNCDFYGNGGDGVEISGVSGTSRLVAENCSFVLNGGYGVNAAGAGQRLGRIINCGFGSGTAANTSGTTNSLKGIDEIDLVTYAANVTPWNDPANGDFTVTLAAAIAAGRGTLPGTTATSEPVIGAAQPRSTVGGGGGGTGRVLTSGSCT